MGPSSQSYQAQLQEGAQVLILFEFFKLYFEIIIDSQEVA